MPAEELPFELGADELQERSSARLERAEADLERLLSDGRGPPTVANFLEPLNRILTDVRDLGLHGSLLFSVHPEATVRTAAQQLSEAADRFYHRFHLDPRAFDRLGALDLGHEADETRFAVEKMLREMRRAGAGRPAAERERLLEISGRIDELANRFSENIAVHVRSIELASPAELDGLPADYRAAHPADPAGHVRITTAYPDFGPVMSYAEHGDVRRRLLYEFANRAYPENLPVLAELLRLRWEYAGLLGYPSYARYALEDKMLADPDRVRAVLDRLAARLEAPARSDLDRYLARKRRDHPEARTLEPWEAQFFGPGYYDLKIRTEEFGVDLRRVRAYLPYGQVRDGLFALCQELLGLEFRRVHAAAWHPSVDVFDVAQDGTPLGRIYLDMVPREGKYTHAACFGVREGVDADRPPHSALVCNFVSPVGPRDQGRMEYGEVVVFFHEFGHLLHALFAGRQRWLYNGMSHLEWDFVEAPSQFFEEWARTPSILARFARDPETGAPIPPELVARIGAASALGRPGGALRQVGLSSVSLELYSRAPEGRDLDADALATINRYGPSQIPADYHFVAAFGHLAGYSAFYYTYVWSAVIARDLLSPFLAEGRILDPALARKYAAGILAPGSRRPAAELVRGFLGRDVSFDAYERWATQRPESLAVASGTTGAPPGPTPAPLTNA